MTICKDNARAFRNKSRGWREIPSMIAAIICVEE
jgi:hypothetical protein